jgi:Amt family ammonium transporter
LRVDDPVWAIACHGVCGLWGLLALGIFANGDYLDVSGLIDGGTDTFVAQLASMGAVVAWTGVVSFIIFGLIKVGMGLRVSEADEDAGLDATEFTQLGYVTETV